ncbi:MAG: DNA repair protein RecN [Flavobacteriales bacterium]|jgi:DNA repair protein RecN (Recombination protein N)|nr:DNA repair protein RecN [Flavobacteriales bacterium]
MLKKISIKNYALIEALELDFQKGFTVLTGETGSGKSILLGALGLILGERADLKSLRDKGAKCIIEGTFEMDQAKFSTFFQANDIDFDKETLLRREITPSGKSRAFVNDTPVNLAVLKSLGERLIDIHSQNQTQQLNTSNFQYQVLDVASNAQQEFQAYQGVLKVYEKTVKELEDLKDLQQKANAEQDYIRFQLEELSNLDLSINKEELEQEYNLLANAEDVIRVSEEAANVINNDQNGVVNALQELKAILGKLERVDHWYGDLLARINSVAIELQDIDFELANKVGALEMDEERLVYLDELLGEINRLEKKYNVIGIQGLVDLKEELEQKENTFSSLEQDIIKLTEATEFQFQEVLSKGKKLSEARLKGVPNLEHKIKAILTELAMPNAVLKVQLSPLEEPTSNGLEEIDFQVVTNKGMAFNSLKKVASGGELSRIMLAIKTILAEKGMLPTLIFDEIDTGVSGEVANKIGEIMKQMGRKMQLMSITHLPQVASKGSYHIKVYKEDRGEVTNTFIKTLNHEERLVEIAKMLSGNNPTNAALDNAKELLN